MAGQNRAAAPSSATQQRLRRYWARRCTSLTSAPGATSLDSGLNIFNVCVPWSTPVAAGSKALLEAATWFRGYSGAIAAEDVACALEALADGAPAKWVRKD